MTSTTSVGDDDPRAAQESGIDDEARTDDPAARAARERQRAPDAAPEADVTREDIEQGNDRAVSADQNNRAGRTNRLADDGIELGKP